MKDTGISELHQLPKGYHLLRVSEIRSLTADAVTIFFEVPKEISERFFFKPGQHLDLLIKLDGEELHRSYSICSGPNEPLSIGVKGIANGRVSQYLNKKIKRGDFILVSEPKGSFILNEKDKKVVLIGAGSGITPLFSIFKNALASSKEVTLVYGNRNEGSIMFRNEIAEIISAKVFHFLSGEQKPGFYHGRINNETLSSLILKDPSILNSDAYYLCGPEAMITEIRKSLESHGVQNKTIHCEYFSAPVNRIENDSDLFESPSGKYRVKVKLDGDKYEFETEADDTVLLDAAKKAGIDAPFSCKTGICGSCRAKIILGSAVMKANYALTEEEISMGYILTCQAQPTCEELTISYDD